MIQRQRAHGEDLLAGCDLLQRRLVPGLGLQQVGHQIAVQQHRALADTGGAAGVLQHRDVVGPDLGRGVGLAPALRQCVVEAHRLRQRIGRHHLLHLAHDVVDDRALDQAQHVAHRGEQHLLGRHGIDHLRQRGGEVLQDHDRLGAGVLELVLELARRVQRVDVDHHVAGPQDRRHRHRVLRHVGQHHRDAVALVQAQRLQVGRQRARRVVDLAERHRLAHEDVGRQRAVLDEALLHQRDQRRVQRDVDLCRHARGVLLQPDLFHLRRSCSRRADSAGRMHQSRSGDSIARAERIGLGSGCRATAGARPRRVGHCGRFATGSRAQAGDARLRCCHCAKSITCQVGAPCCSSSMPTLAAMRRVHLKKNAASSITNAWSEGDGNNKNPDAQRMRRLDWPRCCGCTAGATLAQTAATDGAAPAASRTASPRKRPRRCPRGGASAAAERGAPPMHRWRPRPRRSTAPTPRGC